MNNMPYIDRDVSWLSFNYRVLQEAKDPSVPLLERVKFLAIYSSNLDEFFRIRIANHRNLLRVGKKTMRKLDYAPAITLNNILKIVTKQQEEFSYIFENQIVPLLQENRIFLLRGYELNPEQRDFIDTYFENNLLPFVQPVLLVKNKIRPFLNNAALYLVLHLRELENPNSPPEYAIIKIPSDHIPRFIGLPSSRPERHDLIILDDVVRHSVQWLFPGYEIIDSYSIKLTRDAELYIDDEFSGDLIQKIRRSLTKRSVGPASRLVYDREMPDKVLHFLMNVFELAEEDLMPEGRYHNNSDFFKFPNFDKIHLKEIPLPPLQHPLEKESDFFAAIKQSDHMVHMPYQSYESVILFFEKAAQDPQVTHIKIIQYRVAQVSRIMNALIQAVEAGKHVSAFIEVKARFDEQANIEWGEKLEKAGVNVHYSFPGLKVHSKVALVRRIEPRGPFIYTYFSTGNFHEGTARIYSDFGLFTGDRRLTREAARLFSYLETVKRPRTPFRHILVGQFGLREKLEDYIRFEIEQAKAGKASYILLKLNSLQDTEMIQLLYEASQAGVKIKLIIRGICSLVPGVRGYSENIECISIVDRFLEHARVYVFHHGGKELMYLGSADWMTRNLSHRIETAIPIYNASIKKTIHDLLQIQLNDNVKARLIRHKLNNQYKRDGSDLAIRSQTETYYYFKRLQDEL
ncbi:MAG: polyphosphate kinase 1 [Saprospiraceae bacterium]